MNKEPAKREIKQERAARTRVEILEAAITLFARRGYLATTMADLARAIRMTPGALYWHFPTKEDLLLAAIADLHERYLREFVDLLTEHRKLPAREQLLAFMRRTTHFLGQHREYGIFFSLVAAESAESNDRVAEAIREKIALYVEVLAGILRYGQRTQEFRIDMEPQHLAHTLMGSYLGLLLHQNLFRTSVDYNPVMAALDGLVASGLRPAPSGS
ncbi:TetR family transcriptional regulator [Corallococcus sp. H22C18031201]|uniref:TetR/AcrR family transcriptional regulator n=1 Tax=Citreicoccus inhibens TaxID=2849499 RepID=UPI000E72CEDF|nr:TetR family transcriptional regulator [Citreicoccus inhibens]MBU8898755.1 TetR/AcrR family transcriptional regulator [Citreicoccus inhibens]RJS24128.1 TetR family transcriptional regulator [Corallococcus sp. H22C18031201]